MVRPTFPCCIHCTHWVMTDATDYHLVPCIPCGQGQPEGDDQ